MDKNNKISVVGTGKIVNEVLPLITRDDMHYTITSVYAYRNVDNARCLAEAFDIEKVYTDYDELLCDDTADFIYIANVNTAHYEYALKALESGRNVIVEKPLCTCYDDAYRLIDTAQKNHCYIFEAVSLLYNPVYDEIADALKKIGKISMVTANYSQLSSRYKMYCDHVVAPAFDPELAGGALMDLNVYNINFLVGLFGRPDTSSYFPRLGYNGVDLAGAAVLKYTDFPAVCCSAKDSDAPSGAVIQGDVGYITVDSPVSVLACAKIYIDGKLDKVIDAPVGSHRLEFEFKKIHDIYMRGDYDAMIAKSNISLWVMEILESLRKS